MDKNKFSVLLIHPRKDGRGYILDNLRYPPIGILTLASILRNEGIEPYIYDANTGVKNELKEIFEIVDNYKINAIGLSFTSNLAISAFNLADRLKQKYPELPVIAGGYHPTVMHEDVARNPSIDYVVIGEAEVTLPQLLRRLQSGCDATDVKGLCFKKNKELIYTGINCFIDNLDDIPIPAYDLININKYSSPSSTRKPYLTMIRSRGCPFNCTFCGVDKMFGKRYRCQSPERTMEDISFLIRKYKVREISFKDSDFIINRKNVEEFCNLLISKKPDLIWSCNARVDAVDADILYLMKKSGCQQITFGIESGSQKMLDVLNKKITPEQIRKAIKLTHKSGIDCVGNFIIGSPGESHDTVRETTQLLKELDLDYASFHLLTALPGSELYEQAIKNKWFLRDNYNEIGFEELSINATMLSNNELRKAVKSAISSFYFRPKYIMKRIAKLTPAKIYNDLRCAIGLVSKFYKE